MSKPTNYGSKYWAITGEGDTLFLNADWLEVLPSGALIAWGGFRKDGAKAPDEHIQVYGIAKGEWHTFYAASCLSGGPVAFDDE